MKVRFLDKIKAKKKILVDTNLDTNAGGRQI
jgi:hypothetical protein